MGISTTKSSNFFDIVFGRVDLLRGGAPSLLSVASAVGASTAGSGVVLASSREIAGPGVTSTDVRALRLGVDLCSGD